MYRRFGKRLLDVTLASAALLLLLPFIGLLALLVRSRLGTPAVIARVAGVVRGATGRRFTLTVYADDKRKISVHQRSSASLKPGGSQRIAQVGNPSF